MVPHGDRSGVVIEPYLTDQWYVDAKTLAQPAIAAVRSGATTFVPKNWEKTYFEWMENIQPWCISRQLWWGHQIPAWYGPDGKVFVAETEEEAVGNALGYYVEQEVITPEQGDEMALDPAKREGFITRDEDVLDTWFSSALWPFSTLGWPDDDAGAGALLSDRCAGDGLRHHLLLGRPHDDDGPSFHEGRAVLRPSTSTRSSATRRARRCRSRKATSSIPLDLIDDYGADALRFTLAAMAAQGRDIKLSTQRVEGYRNFATKLWNACRFAEMNGCVAPAASIRANASQTLNRWIAHEAARATREVTEAIESYRFNDAAGSAYRFVWNVYCDWYLELAKPVLLGEDGAAKAETRAMVAWTRDEILKLLHPFMPFITEELWAVTASRNGLLVLSEWPVKPVDVAAWLADNATVAIDSETAVAALARAAPDPLASLNNPQAEAEIGWMIDLITAVRSLRSEMNIAPATLVPLVLVNAPDETQARATRWIDVIRRLARLSDISFATSSPEGSVQLLVRSDVAALPLKGVIDFAAERARLDKEIARADADIKRVDAKLGNERFVANAPEEIVEQEKEKRDAASERRAKLLDAMERLKSVN
jgi:valyl-tRNA synthetase